MSASPIQDDAGRLLGAAAGAPAGLGAVARFAASLEARGDTEQAIALYGQFLAHHPAVAAAHFNLALLYRRNRQHQEALAEYRKALRLGIDRPEEVYVNMGVLHADMRRPEEAARLYERALAHDPAYLPALYNRGGLAEEAGDAGYATALYRRILSIDPRHAGALARLANMRRISDPRDPLVATLRAALAAPSADPAAREALAFALGKALEDAGLHEDAFSAWRAGNELAARRLPPYDRRATEAAFDELMRTFDREWIRTHACETDASPIFICGMFRSGSTLVEQMLAAHPAVTAGGELDLLPWLAARRLAPYPQAAARASRAELSLLADRYLAHLHALFPGAAHVTDKRPDNFLYLGVAKAMFPAARIVVTRREPLDNCLSIFSQHLGGLTYSTDPAHAAHYYGQQARLVDHWMACFGDQVRIVDYDELVRGPERCVGKLLEFLGLEWDVRCLEPARAGSIVSTASLWQVREPLHTRASGRSRLYRQFLEEARAELSGTRGDDLPSALHDPPLREAARRLDAGRIADAERLLRDELARRPDDVTALAMLADVLVRRGRYGEGEILLRRCLALAPGYRAARHNLAVALLRQGRPDGALQEANRLLEADPDHTGVLALQAATLMQLLRHDAAIATWERVVALAPTHAGAWSSLGHALRTVGRTGESIAAYRRALTLAPDRGEPYWNLANLKTVPLTDADFHAMQERLDRPGLSPDDRAHFHFALGRALEQRRDFAGSFRHYAEGNRLRHGAIRYDPDELSRHVTRCKALFTTGFFEERAGFGCESSDPLFVVGLPRSGSTLVEQILASHSQVESTGELAYVPAAARSLSARGIPYPEALAELDAKQLRALGRQYLDQTRPLRHADTPHFIDKLPGNFVHLALIHLMLPRARIVDVRRHPMACGLSLFTQQFAGGQPFSYALRDIGRWYRDYAELMAHFDAVLPGRVHRVHYEALVEDTEGEVRRLLAHCGLPFEDACLRWFEHPRRIGTASSEQVRGPISKHALDHWRNYEPWLTPLARPLGALARDYPVFGSAPATGLSAPGPRPSNDSRNRKGDTIRRDPP